jgi:hypothetical protein
LNKAQIFTTDFIMAFTLFTILFSASFLAWEKLQTKAIDEIIYAEMTMSSERIANQLITVRGTPFDWEKDPQNAQAIGLAEYYGLLSKDKLTALQSLDGGGQEDKIALREIMGAGNHRLYLRITNITGYQYCEIGETPSDELIAYTRRFASVEDQPVIVEVSIWGGT